MKRHIIYSTGLSLLLLQSVWAADLTAVDRSIRKLPEFTADRQEYCLLVFGPQAAKRVWIVRDGSVLYVDRNANGDLTEPGERIVGDPKQCDDEKGTYYFKAGEIPDEPREHKDLSVSWFNIDHLKDEPSVRGLLARNPNFRACRVQLDMALEGQQGTGLGGRVTQTNWDHSFLATSANPEEAPVVHFGGPWQVIGGVVTFRVGQKLQMTLAVGTDGVGGGSSACVYYEGVIPGGLHPKAKITFPPAGEGQEPITQVYELTQRCCGINLYGDIDVPTNIGTGMAKIELTLEGVPGVYIAPRVREARVLPAPVGPALEPVSVRLKRRLPHSNEAKKNPIASLKFSPDGKRLIGGDYPGGVVNIWDLASGQRQASFDTGEGLRGALQYFVIAPDWQTILAPTNYRPKVDKIEKDGQTVYRASYDCEIRVWDVNSGKLTRTLNHEPSRGIRFLTLSPDGKYFLTYEEVPGEFSNGPRPNALSLWNTETGEHREVEKGYAYAGAISNDSRLVAVSIPVPDHPSASRSKSLTVFRAPEWVEHCRIPVDEERDSADASAFMHDGRTLVGTVRSYERENDFRDFTTVLKFWDLPSGQEIFAMPLEGKGSYASALSVSPNGKTVAVNTGWLDQKNMPSLHLIDPLAKSVRSLGFSEDDVVRECTFHPSGKYLATVVQNIPASMQRSMTLSETRVEQPRILLIDVDKAEVLETLIAPQSFPASICFSPDGNTLATGGAGEVLLWDMAGQVGVH